MKKSCPAGRIACAKPSDSGESRELGKVSEKRGASIIRVFFCSLLSAPLPYSSHLSPLSERLEQATGRWVAPPSKAGDSTRRVTLLAGPTFCFSCKHLTASCKETYEKLARQG